MSRFDYVQWDPISQGICDALKARVSSLESNLNVLYPSRERSLALTALEECFMWIGKAIRHDQLKRSCPKEEDGTLPLPLWIAKVNRETGEIDLNPFNPCEGWEVVSEPRNVGGIMMVEVRKK